MNRTVVTFFSASGVTAKVANLIAETISADLYEITPEQKYTKEDLNWNNPESRSTIEMKDPASRVAIAGEAIDLAQYDTILVGYPVWWGVAPHIINSFLERADLAGKTVIPFATSGSSDIGDVEAYLGVSVKGAVLQNAKRLPADADKAAIEAWLN